ncbi:hypothetical protein [Corallococcus carmarthensis]|nr:hypothetical protein [Corallococcus carmarthensis]
MRSLVIFIFIATSSAATAADNPTSSGEATQKQLSESISGLESISMLSAYAFATIPHSIEQAGLSEPSLQALTRAQLQAAGLTIGTTAEDNGPNLIVSLKILATGTGKSSQHVVEIQMRLHQEALLASDQRRTRPITWFYSKLSLHPSNAKQTASAALDELTNGIDKFIADTAAAKARLVRLKAISLANSSTALIKETDDKESATTRHYGAAPETTETKRQRRIAFYNSPSTPRSDPDFYTTTSGADATTFVRMFRLKELNPSKRKEFLESDAELFGCVAQTFLEMGFSRLSVQEMDTHEEVVKEMASLKSSVKCESAQAGDKRTSAQD